MRARAGFTILEVVVVMLLLAVATALTMPALRSGDRADEITLAGRQIEELFGLARDSARASGMPVTLTFDSATATAWLLAGATPAATDAESALQNALQLELPPPLRLQLSSARATFSFSPSGAVFGDSLVLVHGSRTILLTVDPWTGDVIAQ